MKYSIALPLLAASSLILSSCALGLAGTAGALVGTAAVQEGGVARAVSDARIQTEINERWFSHSIEMFRKLDLTINQGRVLITGVVQDPQHRVEAVRLAWQPIGVIQVINEIKVADSEGIVGFAKDVWISGRLRAALIADADVESINYSIDTVQGTIYLMGFAQDQGELNHVIQKARTVGNVKQVVSYVKMVGEPEVRNGSEQYQPRFDGNAPVYGSQPSVNQQYGNNPSYGSQSYENGQAAAQGQMNDAANGDPIQWNQESLY